MWLCGYVAVRLCGCVAVRLGGYGATRLRGSVAMRLCGYAAMWLCGYVAVRLCGYAARRLCGCAARWTGGHAVPIHHTLHTFALTIGSFALHPNASRNSGMFCTVPLMRNGPGECGSDWAMRRTICGDRFEHHTWAKPRKKR